MFWYVSTQGLMPCKIRYKLAVLNNHQKPACFLFAILL